ncbi:MAG: RNA helicase, partial [Actinobacteria bacterium]|nr:RNA helicase [Actinomycetota bacterium]
PGDEALAALTGSRRPTGEPVTERPEPTGRGRYDARRPQGRRGAADYARGRSSHRSQGRPGGTWPQRRAS